ENQIKYFPSGNVYSTVDPLLHETRLSYDDAFSDGGHSGTFAYVTTVTDADNFASTRQYDYYSGALTAGHDPKGAEMRYTYDSACRISQETYHDTVTNQDGTYTRYVYPASENIVQTFTLTATGMSETYSATLLDGAGRARGYARDFPGS